MRRIATVYLPVAILAAALVLGGVKLASEVFAQPQTELNSQSSTYDDGWLVSSFSSIVFEKGLWDQVGVEGDCTLYSSLPEEEKSATVMASNGNNVVTRSYPRTGATVKVCNLIVYLPPTNAGFAINPNTDE